MHRIERIKNEPASFRKYREKYLKNHSSPNVKPNPREDWEVFGSVLLSQYEKKYHNLKGGKAKTLKEYVIDLLAENQYGLCAYCEAKLPLGGDRRIEHFHPKSDMTTNHCWMFDWDNLLAVCEGGASNLVCEVADDESGRTELHCDAAKGSKQDSILNPYTMPRGCLFSFDDKTGELSVNVEACKNAEVDVQLVRNTIDVLFLNCKTLKGARRDLAIHYKLKYQKHQDEMSRGKMAKGPIRKIIAEEWFGNGKVLSFYTVRRCLLGRYAEQCIKTN